MRLLAAVALLALGLACGLATVALHAQWWTFGLALVTTAVTLYAVPPGWWSRLAYSVGWVAVVGYATNPRPEGDYVISSDAAGYLLLGAGLVVLLIGISTLPRPSRRAASTDVPGTGTPGT